MPLSSRHEVTVEWGDCDPAGIVYYPSYFRWFDQATYPLFLAAGLKRDDISSGQWKEGTPLVAAECSFRRASQHGEKLVMESHIEKFGRSSFVIRHVLRQQAVCGVDVVNDGEQPRVGLQTYVAQRMKGFGGESKRPRSRDFTDFPVFADFMVKRIPRRSKVTNAPQAISDVVYEDL